MISLEEEIKSFGMNLGFEDVGIASVDGDVPFVDEVRQAHEDGHFGPLDYLDRTLTLRLDLRAAFPQARSVVMVVKNYYTGDHPQNQFVKAKIARYAWGLDYHQWFKKRLKQFKPFLDERLGRDVQIWPFNDTKPMLERAWAYKAGLGFLGKSAMFIHRKLGTWTLLGGLATDIDLAADAPYRGPDCGSCHKCLDACPTGALVSPHRVDANKCISTWTIERPLHEQSKTLAPRGHSWGFGCDICQEVCPWNKFQTLTAEPRFLPRPGRIFLSRETFLEDLRGSPLHRATKSGLLANFLRIRKSLSNKNIKSSEQIDR